MHWIEAACRTNLEENVTDPELRERLRPEYRAACKRLIISPNFYEAIQAPNAELVTEAIERIVPEGVRTKDGELHELDVLVLATGFHADAFMRPMAGDRARRPDPRRRRGPSGRTRTCRSRSRTSRTSSCSTGPNGPVGNFSLIEVAELQFGYVMQLDRAAAIGRVPRGQRDRDGDGGVRGVAGRGGEEDRLGHRLPQLVPRRPRHPRDVAVAVRPVPRRDGSTRSRKPSSIGR